MYTIIMNDEKQLIQTVRKTIHQKEKNVDKILFLLPQTYNDMNIADYTVTLKYRDQGNEPHGDVLELQTDLYKDRLKYIYTINTDFTRFAGNINLYLSFLKLNTENGIEEEVMHTGATTITIQPIDVFDDYVPDSGLSPVDQALLKQEALYEATKALAETFEQTKADGLSYIDNKLTLTANGEIIPDSEVEIKSCTASGDGDHAGGGYDEDGIPTVDFDSGISEDSTGQPETPEEPESETTTNGTTDTNKEVVEF